MKLARLALTLGITISAGGAGCFLDGEEETAAGTDRVTGGGETSALLKSTLVLETGCMAAKVGPRHLLLAARCVAGYSELAPGKTLSFQTASALREQTTEGEQATEDEEAAEDEEATEDEQTTGDEQRAAIPKPARKPTKRTVTIEEIEIHPSYAAKCRDERCALGAIGASNAKDIAVIILDADLDTVPTVAVDLDTVGQSDTLLAIGSGCKKLDGTPSGVKTFRTIAVPAKSVNHSGSPYVKEPALVTRLNSGYVVTPGVGWRRSEPRICSTDMGAPLFRSGQAAVAGITSNFTTFATERLVPVTVHHTKVDTASKVGTWLASLGVETTHSCSEAPGGCTKKRYDGGLPGTLPEANDPTAPSDDAGEGVPIDGGAEPDAEAPVGMDLPDQGEEVPEPEWEDDDDYAPRERSDDGDDDAGPRKRKKKDAGCSAAPGSMPSSGDGVTLVLGMALAGAVARRRRR